MLVHDKETATYLESVNKWRQTMEDSLRSDDGWLTLAGLHWLHDGSNSVGSDPSSDVPLPEGSVPKQLGSIEFKDGQATLVVTTDEALTVDGEVVKSIALRDDSSPDGPSLVKIGAVTFFVIKREDMYGIRVRDRNNPDRATFGGRHWFQIDPNYRVKARYTAHPAPRTIQVVSSNGQITPMKNSGYLEFELNGQPLKLEAFDTSKDELWLILKDGSSGPLTYKAGRFLYAPRAEDGTYIVDFNRAYHPPCAFTPYATCPLPPKENILPVKIEAGERL